MFSLKQKGSYCNSLHVNMPSLQYKNKTKGKQQIYCLGFGVKGFTHLTLESHDIIKKARIVLHTGLPDRKIHQLNSNIKSLEHLYWSGKKDLDTYKTIAKSVINTARSISGPTVFIENGNPAFFNDITWEIHFLATKKHIPVTILPGISCLDALAIDLCCDMGDVGTQIFEANQLVIYNLVMNPYLSTFILQVGWFGMHVLKNPDRRRKKFGPLIDHLLKYYSETHPAFFVISSEKPKKSSTILRTTVSQIGLYTTKISSGMTLYLPRLDIRIKNRKFYQSLK